MAKVIVDVNEVFGWGYNRSGVIGNGNSNNLLTPTFLFNDFEKVCAVNFKNYGIKSDCSLWVWGCGQMYLGLGSGCTSDITTPVQIPGIFVSDIFAGSHNTFAKIPDSDNYYVWGSNCFGELGIGNCVPVCVPTLTECLSPYCKISSAIGNHYSFGIKSDCTLWAWGCGFEGVLGNSCQSNQISPIQIPGTWICTCSYSYTVGQRVDGTLWTWGNLSSGQSGTGSNIGRSSPVQVFGMSYKDFFIDNEQVMSIKEDGSLWAWGANFNGELGTNNTINRSSPVQIPGNWNCLRAFGIAEKEGNMFTWGNNNIYQLGIGNAINQSSPVMLGQKYQFYSKGTAHTLAQCKLTKEYNKNDNSGTWTLNKVYQQKINDTWSDFIPTIDD